MTKQKRPIEFQYSLNNSFKLIYAAFVYPKTFIRKLIGATDTRSAIYFFITIFIISSSLRVLYQTFLFRTPSALFLGITSIVLSIPFGLAFLWILSGAFYIISLLLRTQISFKKILVTLSYAFAPAILIQLPVINIAGWTYLLTILITCFYLLTNDVVRAIFIVITPFLLILIIAFLFGLLNFSLI